MGKQNLYEHNKAPLIIAGPGIPHGTSDAMAYLFDLFPTLCDYAGQPIPGRADGRSLLPVIKGEKSGVRDLLLGAHTQLFDLQTDPDELHNLSADPAHAETLAKLRGQLHAALKDHGDPVDFSAPFNAEKR